MKFLIILALVAMTAAFPGKYSEKFKDVKIEEIIENDRLMKSYIDCFNGEGKCTGDGKDLKEVIPEGVKTACSECSDDEKPKVAKFIHAARTRLPDKWEILYKKNDPTGERKGELDEFVTKYAH